MAVSLVMSGLAASPVGANGEADWVDQFGTAGDDEGHAVAVTDEAVFAVGYRGASYLRKYLPNGDMAWERSLPTASIEAVAADAAGSGIFIAGQTSGALPGQPPPHGGIENYVARYSPDGGLVWARQFFLPALGAPGSRRRIASLQLTTQGVFVAGDGETTSYVRMFDVDGNTRWTRNVPAHLETMSADAYGAVVISSSVDFLSPTMRGFDNAGSLRFTRAGPGYQHTAAPGPGGAYYLAYARAVSGSDRGFVTQYDRFGTAGWTHVVGGIRFYQWGGITRFGTRLYVTWDEDTGPVSGPGLDQWAALSSTTGATIWHHDVAVEPGSGARPTGIAVAPHGGYLGGSVEGALDGQVSSGGSLDAFLMRFIVDTAAPNILFTGYALPPRVPLTIDDFTGQGTWTLSDNLSGVRGVELQESSNDTDWNDVLLPEPTATSALIDVKPNESHRFRVRASDRSGNKSKWSLSKLFQTDLRQEDAAGTIYDADWKAATLAGASGGSVMTTSTAGAIAKFDFTGDAIGLVMTRGPHRGAVDVYLDGTLVKTLDTYAPNASQRWMLFARNFASVGPHQLKLIAKGTGGRPRVDVDAFEVRSTSP